MIELIENYLYKRIRINDKLVVSDEPLKNNNKNAKTDL